MRLAAVPDRLLVPLLDAAAEVLRGLPTEDVPITLRTVSAFDRRGLTSGVARRQLRRAFDVDDAFRAQVIEAFTGRAQVRTVLDGWSAIAAGAAVADAAARDDLPLLVSALYAAQPEGAEFGLGLATAEDGYQRSARALVEDARAAALDLASAEEARRRADEALAAARGELSRLEAELREERRARRERESAADRRVEEAQRAAHEAAVAAEGARRDGEVADARAHREAARAREAERRLRERGPTAPPPAPGERAPDPAALRDLARRARELAAGLERLGATSPGSAASRSPGDQVSRPAPAGRRAPVVVPPGRRADQPDGLEAMLRTPGVTLVVDGYNVSMTGWAGAPVDQQRDQLLASLGRLHLRVHCLVVVVFDGADVGVVTPRRIPGVRVVFSDAGEAADPVIISEVATLPPTVPAVVASNDRWVRDEAARAGASVVASEVLLAVARR